MNEFEFIWLMFWTFSVIMSIGLLTQLGIYLAFQYYKWSTSPFDFEKRLDSGEILDKDNIFKITYKGWANEHSC